MENKEEEALVINAKNSNNNSIFSPPLTLNLLESNFEGLETKKASLSK